MLYIMLQALHQDSQFAHAKMLNIENIEDIIWRIIVSGSGLPSHHHKSPKSVKDRKACEKSPNPPNPILEDPISAGVVGRDSESPHKFNVGKIAPPPFCLRTFQPHSQKPKPAWTERPLYLQTPLTQLNRHFFFLKTS